MTLNDLGEKKTYIKEMIIIEYLRESFDGIEDIKLNSKYSKILNKNPEIYNSMKKDLPLIKNRITRINNGNLNLNEFEILRQDDKKLKKFFKGFIRNTHFRSKNSWNPADIYLIKKNQMDKIINLLSKVSNNKNFDSKTIINVINRIYLTEFKKGNFYPISLKNLKSDDIHLRVFNIKHKDISYTVQIDKFIINFINDQKYIGQFTFKSIINPKKLYTAQVRAFNHGFKTVQIDFRDNDSFIYGKTPTEIVEDVFKSYNSKRKMMSYFGNKSKMYFTNFNSYKVEYFWKIYQFVINHSKIVKTDKVLDKNDFINLIEEAKNDKEKAQNLIVKLQGLDYANFFLENINNLEKIFSKFLNGARKIGSENSVCVHLY